MGKRVAHSPSLPTSSSSNSSRSPPLPPHPHPHPTHSQNVLLTVSLSFPPSLTRHPVLGTLRPFAAPVPFVLCLVLTPWVSIECRSVCATSVTHRVRTREEFRNDREPRTTSDACVGKVSPAFDQWHLLTIATTGPIPIFTCDVPP